jgi:hypothetical protein
VAGKHAEELLPVAYSHVVFTLPHKLIPLARHNPTVVYNIFFGAVSQGLLTIAADPQHVGARLGFLAVLALLESEIAGEPSLMMPGIIISSIFSKQGSLAFRATPLQN